MQVAGAGDRRQIPPMEAWGAGFVHALRQARALPPTGTSPVSPAGGPPRAASSAPPAAAAQNPRQPAPSPWQRFLNLLTEALRGALDLLRSGVDALLRALGG